VFELVSMSEAHEGSAGTRGYGFRPKKMNLAVLGEMCSAPTLRELDNSIGLLMGGRGRTQGKKRKADGVVDPSLALATAYGIVENFDVPEPAEKKRRPSKSKDSVLVASDENPESCAIERVQTDSTAIDSTQPPAWAGHALLQGLTGSGVGAEFGRVKTTTSSSTEKAAVDDSELAVQAKQLVQNAFAKVGVVLDIEEALQRTNDATECLETMMNLFPAQPPQRPEVLNDLITKRQQLRELLSVRRHIDEALGRFLVS